MLDAIECKECACDGKPFGSWSYGKAFEIWFVESEEGRGEDFFQGFESSI